MSNGTRFIARYVAYLLFAFAALIFWALYFVVVMGIVPFAEPRCWPNCPDPTMWQHALTILGITLPLPLTVFVFVFYRRWVRRCLGYIDE